MQKPLPILLDGNEKPRAVLTRAYGYKVADQLLSDDAGKETVSFSLPGDDPDADLIATEDVVDVDGRLFRVRVANRRRTDRGLTEVKVDAEALWYDLREMDLVSGGLRRDVYAGDVMRDIVAGTGWSVGTVEQTQPADFYLDSPSSPLKALRTIPAFYGGDVWFDTKARTVHLFTQQGQDRDHVFSYGDDLSSVAVIEDTRDLVTRLYAYGADGLTIGTVNGGVDYLEDESYYTERGMVPVVKVDKFTDERITNPYYLKMRAEQILEARARPKTTINVKVVTPDDEPIHLGDRVHVYDPEHGLRQRFRVAARDWHPTEPHKTKLTLEDPQPTLAQALLRPPQPAEAAGVGGPGEVDLSPFNLLLNGRAENGVASWAADGFTTEAGKGVSGGAAFRADAAAGATKTLSQTVWPPNHSAYVLALQTELSGLTVNAGGHVGVRVTVHYTDGVDPTETFHPIVEGS